MPEPKAGEVWERKRGSRVERRTILRIERIGALWYVVYTKPWKYGGLSLCIEDRPSWKLWSAMAEVVNDPE